MQDKFAESQALSRERKIGFVFLLIFAILTVSLGVLQLRNTIYGPYAIKVAKKDSVESLLLKDEDARLQQIDTDHDGINDYEELFFYETSPYIPDTDSDGISDKEELEDGTDPLCPKGQDCGEVQSEAISDQAPKQEVIGSPIVGNVKTAAELLGGATTDQPPEVDIASELATIATDADILREMLLATGNITQEELDKVTDEQLLESAKNLLSTQGTAPVATEEESSQ